MTIIEVFSIKSIRDFLFCLFLLEWPEPRVETTSLIHRGGEGLNVKKKKEMGGTETRRVFLLFDSFPLDGQFVTS